MDIGECLIVETVKGCSRCGKVFESEELKDIVPDSAKFGFDTMVRVGEELFLKNRTDKEVWEDLKRENVDMSLREIGHLGRDFILYLTLAHKEIQPDIRALFEAVGGFIAHFDSTQADGSPLILSALDEMSNIVLGSVKVLSESADHIIPFMQRLKEAFGIPLAVVTDMAAAFALAIKTVFGDILHLICHFHFLRDIGKDLFGYENARIKGDLSNYETRPSLRALCKDLKELIDQDKKLTAELTAYLNQQKAGTAITPSIYITLYTLIVWVLDYENASAGYGFPFDQPYLDFYHRLEKAREVVRGLSAGEQEDLHVRKLCGIIDLIIEDPTCREFVRQMEKKVVHFNMLREALRIAMPDGDEGLNDDGVDVDIKAIEKAVTAFINLQEIKDACRVDISYKKMIKQIKKYWTKLFAEPIKVTRADGTFYFILPQRTNNILERFFRDLKKNFRQKCGGNALGKRLTAMLAETPLVKNLLNDDYYKILLGDKENLALRFAEIDRKLVVAERKKNKNPEESLSPVLKKLLELPNLPEMISQAALLKAA